MVSKFKIKLIASSLVLVFWITIGVSSSIGQITQFQQKHCQELADNVFMEWFVDYNASWWTAFSVASDIYDQCMYEAWQFNNTANISSPKELENLILFKKDDNFI